MKSNIAKMLGVGVYVVVSAILLADYSAYLDKPDGSVWDEANRYITSSGYSTMPLVFRPGWMKNYATDHGRYSGLNVSGCAGRCPVYWLLSFKDNDAPKGYVLANSMKIFNLWVMLVVDEESGFSVELDNIISMNPSISLELSSNQVLQCSFDGVLGRECYLEDWQRIEKRLMSSAGEVRPCIFVHPRDNTRIDLLFKGVPLRDSLNFSTAIADGLVDGDKSPVYLDVYIGEDLVGKVVQPDSSGWSSTVIGTSKYTGGRSDVRLVVYSDSDIRRHFCFNAQLQ